MTKIKIFITALVLLLSIGMQAQVVGYMGKKLSLGANLNFINDLAGEPLDSKGKSDFGNFAKRYTFSLDYVIGRRITAGFSYHFLRAGVDNPNPAPPNATGENPNIYTLKANVESIYFKFFKKRKGNFLAPIGKYTKLELMAIQGSAYDDNALYNVKGKKIYTQSGFGFGITFGRQGIWWDRVIWNYGTSFGFPLLSHTASSSQYDNLASNISSRLQSHMIINFQLGLGVLVY